MDDWEKRVQPFTPKISLVILLTVCRLILMIIPGRIGIRSITCSIIDIFLYSLHFSV